MWNPREAVTRGLDLRWAPCHGYPRMFAGCCKKWVKQSLGAPISGHRTHEKNDNLGIVRSTPKEVSRINIASATGADLPIFACCCPQVSSAIRTIETVKNFRVDMPITNSENVTNEQVGKSGYFGHCHGSTRGPPVVGTNEVLRILKPWCSESASPHNDVAAIQLTGKS